MFVLSNGKPQTFNPIRRKRVYEDKRKSKAFHRDKSGELKDKKTSPNNLCVIGNVWEYSVGGGLTTTDKIAYQHPAIFPDKLAQYHIKSWSNESDLVYDPFMGSGTTAKMAHLLKRNWIGSEISKEYTELANKRIQPYLDQQTLF